MNMKVLIKREPKKWIEWTSFKILCSLYNIKIYSKMRDKTSITTAIILWNLWSLYCINNL